MNIVWLEDYLSLIECGGFSRAAEQRAVSQPSFSRRIRALENWVGAILVDRSTHTMRLTPAGERFRSVAEEALRRMKLGCEETRALAKASAETLRFASTHVLSLTFFPAWLRQLDADEPSSVTVELTADHMVACERLMVEGAAQFLLCHHHEAAATRLGADFRSVTLGTDMLLPVMAPGLVTSGNLYEAPQLSFTAESGMGRILDAALSARNRPPAPQPIFSSHLAGVLTAMARDGRGVAWSAMSLVQDDLVSGRLVRAGTEADEISIDIKLWRPRARQALAAEAFWTKVSRSIASEP